MRNTYLTFISVISALLLLCGCTDEQLIDTGGTGTGQALVKFTLFMPSSSVTRAGNVFTAPAYENEVEDLLVFIFRGGELLEIEKPRNITRAGITAKFSISLRATEQPVKFHVLANVPVGAIDKTVGQGTEVEILNRLRDKLRGKTPEEINNLVDDYMPQFGNHGVSAPFPMWGEYDFPQGIPEDLLGVITPIGDMKLIRGVARAIITKSVDDALFKINSVNVLRVHNNMKVIPNAHLNNVVSEPSMPTDRSYSFISDIEVPAGDAAVSFYLTESPGYPPQDADKDATCIIVGGYYNGSPEETYYRIDFKTDPQRVGEIKRNHSYSFNITSVSGPGSPDPGEITGETKITATVEEWENVWGEAIYTNEHYMTLTSRTITVPGTEGSSHYIDVCTDVKNFTIADWEGSAPTGSDKWEDDFFVLEKTEIPLGSQTPDYPPNKSETTSFFRLRVTAKTSNISSEPRFQSFTIKAANLTVPMQIKQSPPVHLRPEVTFTWVTSDGLKSVKIGIQSSHEWFVSRLYDETGIVEFRQYEGHDYPDLTGVDPFKPFDMESATDMTDDPWIMCEKIGSDTLRVYGKPNSFKITAQNVDPLDPEDQNPEVPEDPPWLLPVYTPAFPRKGAILLENEEGGKALIEVFQEEWIVWHPSFMIGKEPPPFTINYHPNWMNLLRYTWGSGPTTFYTVNSEYYHPSDKLYGSANNYFRPAQPVGDHRDLRSWEVGTSTMPDNYDQMGDFLNYDGAVLACMSLSLEEGEEQYAPPFHHWGTFGFYWDLATETELIDLFSRFEISPNGCYYVTNPDGEKVYFPNVGTAHIVNRDLYAFSFFAQHPSYDDGFYGTRYQLYRNAPPAGRFSQQRRIGWGTNVRLWANGGNAVRCVRRPLLIRPI